MSAETHSAQIIALNTASAKLAATNDYSYEPGMNAAEHAEHIAAVRPKLLYANNAVRALGGWLMDALKQHTTPTRFMFRVYTHGDIYLMMRTLFQSRGLQTTVKLGLQSNVLGRKLTTSYTDAQVVHALRQYIGHDGAAVELDHASQYPQYLHGVFVQHGLTPCDIRADGQTVAVAYAWEFEETRYEVHLVSRLDLARPVIDVVETG